MRINEKALGPEHPATAESLNNLAMLHLRMGDYAKAEPLFQRALKINEKALGPDHEETARCLHNFAGLLLEAGNKSGAVAMETKAYQGQLRTLANVLSFTSEQQRLGFQSTYDPYKVLATMGSAPQIASAVLHHKGVVLDSL